MENAVEALKTAAAVLIFAIAITVAFTMFSKAKTAADSIIKAQDSQEYLESAKVAGTLYETTDSASTRDNPTITTDGYRIVKPDDVISTIYRYSLEKYGVTLADGSGNVIARYDSNTEDIVRQYYNLSADIKKAYINNIKNNTKVVGKDLNIELKYDYTNENDNSLYRLYYLEVEGNRKIKCGAPWYGNDVEINKRINADIGGYAYIVNKQTRHISKGINEVLKDSSQIIEVVNEIDNSKYLQDNGEKTDLQTQYQMPTIEVIYILL